MAFLLCSCYILWLGEWSLAWLSWQCGMEVSCSWASMDYSRFQGYKRCCYLSCWLLCIGLCSVWEAKNSLRGLSKILTWASSSRQSSSGETEKGLFCLSHSGDESVRDSTLIPTCCCQLLSYVFTLGYNLPGPLRACYGLPFSLGFWGFSHSGVVL